VAALLALVPLLCNCHEVPLSMMDVCPGDPMHPTCRSAACSGPYECVSYCVRYHPEGENIPDEGLGSWCDDARVPDFGEFCPGHDEVAGCEDWCEDHPDRCGATSDGDADSDADGDADSDGDADGDADEDGDTDVECRDDGECTRAEAARCLDGACVACESDDECASVDGLPACEAGVCHVCSASNSSACVGETPHCEVASHECVACLDGAHCTSADAARCSETNECASCTNSSDCDSVDGASVCADGACVACTSNAHCEHGRICNYTTRECVAACHVCESTDDCAAEAGGPGPEFSCGSGSLYSDVLYCFQESETCERPWMRADTDGRCRPSDHTTCEGLVDFGEDCDISDPTGCGSDFYGLDGVCSDDENYCTYRCFTDDECPPRATCGEESGLCER